MVEVVRLLVIVVVVVGGGDRTGGGLWGYLQVAPPSLVIEHAKHGTASSDPVILGLSTGDG